MRAIGLTAYRALLHLYPRDFRERFGPEMMDTFSAALAGRSSRLGRIVFAMRAVIDLFWSALLERRLSSPQGSSHTQPESAMTSISQDLRFAFRSMRRRPAFVAVVVVILALGIGANTAIFSLVDAVLLHPLPIAKPNEVVAIYQALNPRSPDGNVTFMIFRALQARTKSFSGLAGFMSNEVGVRLGERSEELTVGNVSGNYFSVLGVRAVAGRLLTPADDDQPHAHPVVILSDRLWERFFGRKPSAIGATILLGGNPFTVIGVAPPHFAGTALSTAPELWIPLTMVTSTSSFFIGPRADQVFTTLAFQWVALVGRLQPGVTPAHATAELNATYTALQQEQPARPNSARVALRNPMSVRPIVQAAALGDRANLVRFVTILLAVVALTLLLACANVANLLLIRARERAQELRVRMALGARRSRLVRQLFVENLVLAALGAVAGIAVGLATMRLLSTFTLPGGIRLTRAELGLDWRVLAFLCALVLVSALLFGGWPAWRASRPDEASLLQASRGVSRRGSGSLLMTAQIAISLTLLVAAALFVRSLRNGLHTDLGFDPAPLAAISLDLRLQGYSQSRAVQFYEDAVVRARQIPGVTAAAYATHVPLAGMVTLPFSGVDPAKPGSGDATISAGMTSVSLDYFQVLGVRLVEGRLPGPGDDSTAAKVVVLNESAARAFVPHGSPLGRNLMLFGNASYTIIGVVRDTKYESVRDAGVPVVFAPFAQEPATGGVSIVVRSRAPAATFPALRQALKAIDPAVPVLHARVVADQIEETLMPQRFGATLIGGFALIALCVSAIGVYGVVMSAVTQRSREFGIRLALGAQRSDVATLVIRTVGIAMAAGAVLGAVGAALASRGLRQFLYGVAPLDPAAFAGAIAVLAVAAAGACLIPARRAMGIDPAISMRVE